MKHLILLFVVSALIFSSNSFAQKRKDKIKLISTGTNGALERVKRNDKYVNKVSGSDVVFQQGTTFYHCKEAYLDKKKNQLEAIGSVRIVSDSVNVTGNQLFYDGKTKIAQLRGNVVLVDKQMTLYTESLDYNVANNTGNYFGGGRIIDEGNTLTSKNGFYDKTAHFTHFTNNVKLVGADGTLYSEDLTYDLTSKIAKTKGKTVIIGKNGERTESQDFTYYTTSKETVFVDLVGTTEDYVMTGEKTFNDDLRKFSRSEKNVSLTIKKDSITVKGDHGTYDKTNGIAKVWGNLLVISKMQEDTMYMTADSLIAIDEQDNTKDKLLAFNNVKIFKNDLQGKCDSMVYNTGDSTIFLYVDPVLWSQGSQLRADSIDMKLVNKKIDKMNLVQNSFVISQDSIKNFNQIKGRDMTAYFKESKIKQVDVKGNGESIYFMLDEGDSIMLAMNKVICSNMIMRFADQNKLEKVSFINTPDGALIPPHEILEPEKRLKGFNWRIKEKPEKEQLLSVRKNENKVISLPVKNISPKEIEVKKSSKR
jgi:lipopolysaccharide export system protein LptA